MPHSFGFFSNRIELLFDRMKEQLFTDTSNPFTRRIIIVPSPAIKNWILLRLADDKEINIAAGLEIVYLNQALIKIKKLFTNEGSELPDAFDLSCAIEIELRKIMNETTEVEKRWQPVVDFLKVPKKERRITLLCGQLSNLFSLYGIYGGKGLVEWESGKKNHWQAELWRSLFCQENSPFSSYPYREFSIDSDLCAKTETDIQLHLFSFSFLSELHHRFLFSIGKQIPVYTYHLSPCKMFWEDLCSDKEERYLKSKWEKAGAPLIQQLELEEYLRDKNSLLANFGRLGREMVKQLEESGLQVIEDYDLPLPLKNEPRYTPFIDSDIAFRESNQKETMLECLQADLLLLRNPEKITEKKKEFSSDSSIQLHQAPTRYREVEILYNTLMGLIERHSEETKAIQPKDILVMAPNIAEYAPYINAVFGKAESQLPYKLLDQPIQSQSRLVQGFLHLLTLNFGLWELDSILQLFDQSSFQKKHGLTKEEISKIRQWASQMNVRWGKDLLHREEILAGRGFPETNHSSLNGTWEEGISRLLCGYSMIPGEYLNSLQPLPGVDLTDADLIGKWIELIRSLKEDTKIINEETGLTLEEWGKALKKLLETYFTFESTEQIEKQGYEILEAFCRLLQSRSKKFENQRFYFPTIQSQMESFLSQQSIEGEKQLQSVHFSTLFPMRAIPSKVIALIGMEEDSFPRKNRLDPFLSLNQMCGNKEIDYTPSQTDYDRYLFLENILSARNYLILSYPESGSKGEKNASPSLLITELFEYLDKGYTVQGEKISKSCHWKHPFYSFDKSYFAGGSAFPKSYFPSQYRAAIAFYGKEKSGPHRFISDYLYSHIREKAPLKAEIIDLRRLTATAQNPFKSYLNQGLGIYLNRNLNGEEKIKERGEFALSSLDNFLLRKEVLYAPSEAVIKKAEKEGRLPIGLFGALAKDDLEKEKKELKNHFINLEIDPEEFFQIEFNAQLKAPVQHRKGVWNLPAIELTFENQPIKIVGKIEDVTPKGLLIHGKDQLEDVAKAWPQILLLNAAILKFPAMGLTANRLHFTKSLKSRESFADPYPDLINYIDYYRYSLTNLSYLHPEWIEDLLTSEPEHFEKKISSKLMNSYATAYNPYLHWIFNYDDYPKERAVIEIWKQKAELLFGNVYRTWFK